MLYLVTSFFTLSRPDQAYTFTGERNFDPFLSDWPQAFKNYDTDRDQAFLGVVGGPASQRLQLPHFIYFIFPAVVTYYMVKEFRKTKWENNR